MDTDIKSQLHRADGFSGEMSIVLPAKILKKVQKNPVINEMYITDIGYYPNARYHYRSRQRGLDQHILIYAVDGEGAITVNNTVKLIKQNQFFIIPSFEPHEYGANEKDPWSIYWLHFRGEKFRNYFVNFANVTMIAPSEFSRIEYRINLFREIIYCLGMGFYKENVEYANLCFYHLLATFMYVPQFRYFSKQSPQDFIECIILYMKSNIEKQISLLDLSKEFKLSIPQLSKLFKQRTKHSPIDYLIQLKIQKACQLLDQTNLQIKSISTELGYDDPYYFSRMFKKVMSVSPKKYRERHLRT
jgi:AraC family transcriptional regulator, arabinose operon regulatory protein